MSCIRESDITTFRYLHHTLLDPVPCDVTVFRKSPTADMLRAGFNPSVTYM